MLHEFLEPVAEQRRQDEVTRQNALDVDPRIFHVCDQVVRQERFVVPHPRADEPFGFLSEGFVHQACTNEACSIRRFRRGDESPDLGRVFFARRRFNAARNIHAERLHAAHSFPHVLRRKTAREKNRFA